jgi:hypothetical protein
MSSTSRLLISHAVSLRLAQHYQRKNESSPKRTSQPGPLQIRLTLHKWWIKLGLLWKSSDDDALLEAAKTQVCPRQRDHHQEAGPTLSSPLRHRGPWWKKDLFWRGDLLYQQHSAGEGRNRGRIVSIDQHSQGICLLPAKLTQKIGQHQPQKQLLHPN